MDLIEDRNVYVASPHARASQRTVEVLLERLRPQHKIMHAWAAARALNARALRELWRLSDHVTNPGLKGAQGGDGKRTPAGFGIPARNACKRAGLAATGRWALPCVDVLRMQGEA